MQSKFYAFILRQKLVKLDKESFLYYPVSDRDTFVFVFTILSALVRVREREQRQTICLRDPCHFGQKTISVHKKITLQLE